MAAPHVEGFDVATAPYAGSRMPDPTDTTTETTPVTSPSTPVTPPAQAAPTARVFSQEEVDNIVKERLSRAKPAAPVAAPDKRVEPQAAATPSPALTADEVDRRIAEAEEFARATADLDDQQTRFLRGAMRTSKPAEISVAAWVEQTKMALKLGKSPAPPAVTTPAAQAAPTATTATPNVAPAAAPAAPSAHALPTAQGLPDLFNMSPAQIGSLGPKGVRDVLEKLWDIGNQASGAPVRPKPPSQR